MLYLRNFEVEQQLDYHNQVKDIASLNKWILGLGNAYKSIEQICGIIHDKDVNTNGTPKKPHFHIYVRLKTNYDVNWISKVFGVDTQFINKIEGKWKDALAYATHLNRPEKYQYPIEELVLYNMTLNQYNEQAKKIDLEEISIKQAILDYGDCIISKKKLLDEYLKSASMYAKYTGLFKKMQEFRKLKVKDRNMTVLYICGYSGSGKTTLAKYLADIQGYDYFVSGSGLDPFDSYDKEECIILDDLRNDTFTKAELFKLTDNNTDSSVKSRFQNKNISNCKLMIITSIKSPYELYNWLDGSEPFTQFARRIGNGYLFITNEGVVLEKRYSNPNNWYDVISKDAPFNMDMVFAALGINRAIGEDFMKDIYGLVREHLKGNGANGK